MQTKILQKVLEELKKENVDLSYVRGMVETLIEMSGTNTIANGNVYIPSTTGNPLPPNGVVTFSSIEEDETLKKYMSGATGTMNNG